MAGEKGTCFFISPIGARESAARRRSNEVMDILLRERLNQHGYDLVRADQLSDLGRIDDQVIDHLLDAELAVCDLTGLNPNVMYELGVRHVVGKPVVIIAQAGTDLPFDTQAFRTIFYSLESAAMMHEAQTGLSEVLDSLKSDQGLSNPVADRASRRALAETSGVVEEALVRIETQVGVLANHLEKQEEGLREARFEFINGNHDAAIQLYEAFLAHNPENREGLLGLGRAQRRMGFFQRSVDTIGVLLELEPKNTQARYNMACYLCLAGADAAEVTSHLGQAIEVSERYRKYALADSDFERVRSTKEFSELVVKPDSQSKG